MRLDIRRKLIGTLMLVGLFPLAMSLIVILVGGAAMQLSRIRNNYEETASACADRIADSILRDELEKLTLLSRLPPVVKFLREQDELAAHSGQSASAATATTAPSPSAMDNAVDAKWPQLSPQDEPLQGVLNNVIADRLRMLTALDGHPRQVLITNVFGEVVSSDEKPHDYFQADEKWWTIAYNGGKGRAYISSIVPSAVDGKPVIEIALPVMDESGGEPRVVGIMKDKLDAGWALGSLREQPWKNLLGATAQLIDLDLRKTVYMPESTGMAERVERFYFKHEGEARVHIATLLMNDLVIGTQTVPLQHTILTKFADAQVPRWVVVVSKPSETAMSPVYKLALTVAGIGIALILVLFILGVAISNREVIMPILRLREATAAVGRGELNVRLLSADSADATFRRDELGDLARDFDEMTRQLQKNVNQLARSNEAKRRFMELAGHELRTPVTYLIGVCQLAQRQAQQLTAAAEGASAGTPAAATLAAKNAAATQAAIAKISAKTQRLSRIIDNLLKLVNNDQFTTRLNKEPVDMRALLLQVTSDHRPFINERKQQLVVDVAENLPALEADRDKLEDALTNLLSNAIRFSPDGGTVRVAAHEVVGDMLEILVEDSGPGIPQKDLANLFEPFYTGSDILHHHSGTFEYGSKGIGLGLAIVRRFIELHGGIVRAHTLMKEGKAAGTQFQILLPLNRDGEDGAGAVATSPPLA